jgi:flagellar biosynthesis anti-sigma factor FlgM
MRIDFNSGTQAAQETKDARLPGTAGKSSAGTHELGEDQAQLSGGQVQIQALAAQALQIPEIRQERVQALRQAIQSGQYHPDPEKVASRVMVQMMRGVAG